MKVAPLPIDEKERLDTLKQYDILDTLPEMDFDDFTLLASHICEAPIALISLVDESRQWFKSKVGLDAMETPRDVAFCSHAILNDKVFVVKDSLNDERFKDNPLATGAPNVRFYAGAPLITPSGHKIGTLCVIDSVPRNLKTKQIDALARLSRQVVNQLELRLINKEALKTSELKSSFLATMSHEIRTPLNGIIGFSHLLGEEKLSKKALSYVQNISSCSESLLTIINDILDISKIEAGKLLIEKIPFNLKTILEKSFLIFKTNIEKRQLDANFLIHENVPEVILGDPLRMRQIFLNLIGNAVKFTSDGGSIDIIVERGLGRGNNQLELIFTVKDSGVGISLDDQKRLFENFEQADNSTTRNYGGTGLGLSICSKLVSMLGGKIWVESDIGKGASFIFTILTEKSVLKLGSVEESLPLVLKDHLVLNILAAEDNHLNQVLLRAILKKIGQDQVHFTSNGLDVVTAAKENHYDLILMDIQMPKLDGYEATKEIRKALGGDIKIIGLSANAFEDDKLKAIEAGMDGYLEKPIDIDEISKLILEIECSISKRKKIS
ncbi:MAG: signal transduction histidine kinase/ActR/RegA family two-component response regulator [Bacteriovoracaceae bacterium]|jgi:signal transduction histidine kinase/ActR/RegA family two-component response regulator